MHIREKAVILRPGDFLRSPGCFDVCRRINVIWLSHLFGWEGHKMLKESVTLFTERECGDGVFYVPPSVRQC